MSVLTDFTSILNGTQTSFMFWTEQRFREFLLRANLARLPQPTQQALAAVFGPRLVAATKRDWSGFLENGPPTDYTEQDYETFEAINCLAQLRSQEAVQPLTVLASVNVAKDDRERWMSIRALGLIENSTVIPQLIPLVYHFNFNARIWAQIALARLSGVNFGYEWQAWVEWWNSANLGPPMDNTKTQWQVASDVTDAQRAVLLDPKAQIEKDQSFVTDILTGNANIKLN